MEALAVLGWVAANFAACHVAFGAAGDAAVRMERRRDSDRERELQRRMGRPRGKSRPDICD